MCGIVYVKRKDKKPAYKAVLKRYRHQKTRGFQGFGYVAVKNNKIVSYNRSSDEDEIVAMLEKEDAEEILFHHRFPTSTPNIEESAHPLLVEHESLAHQYLVAHNGVIRNASDLKKDHEKLGIAYSTEIIKSYVSKVSGKTYMTDESRFNDSESLAVETALALDGKKEEIATEGTVAVVGFQTKGQNVVERFFFRNVGNPINFFEDSNLITITSAGGGKMVEPAALFKLIPKGGFEPFRKGLSAPYTYNAEKGSYNNLWNGRKKETPVSPMLPAPRMGFDLRARTETQRILEDDFDYPLEDGRGGDGRASRTVEELMDDYGVEEDEKGKLSILSVMTYAQLWEEYNKSVDMEVDFQSELAELEEKFEETADYATTEEMSRGFAVQQKLEFCRDYIGDLSEELTKREAETPIVGKEVTGLNKKKKHKEGMTEMQKAIKATLDGVGISG